MNYLETKLLETARRRGIYASVEAQQLGVPLNKVRNAIQRLRKAGLITNDSAKARPNYWGSAEASYRASDFTQCRDR